ncbi:hypothetical protein QQP08_016398 [Theobroma cacao]|nr:hypothetical protein QQP08_016398 [Theobroma cacao]
MIFSQRYSHQLFTLQSWSAWVFLLQRNFSKCTSTPSSILHSKVSQMAGAYDLRFSWMFHCIWGQYQLGREGIPWIIMAEVQLEASSVRLGSSTTTFDIIFKWSSAFLEMYHS